jgi:hypothetical protein
MPHWRDVLVQPSKGFPKDWKVMAKRITGVEPTK